MLEQQVKKENIIPLEKFIRKISVKISKRLELNPIRLQVDKYLEDCRYYPLENKIIIGLELLNKLKDKNSHTCYVPSDTFLNRVYFSISHELAHHLQFTKHFYWYQTYNKIKINSIINTAEEYVKTKLEQNASKIALILLNEYKKGEQ